MSMFKELPMAPLEQADVPTEARELVLGLLEVNEERRLDARTALAHPWLDDVAMPPAPTPSGQGRRRTIGEVLRHACTFRAQARFQRAILRLVAHYLHEHDVESLKERFETLDLDHS